jgi:nucleotide-binding universal stress UspA family protein
VACRMLMGRGTAYQVIANEAQRIRADLIVMATHGRTGLSHLVMGSVAARVVRTAVCPVLTLHPHVGTARRRKMRRGAPAQFLRD